MNLPKVSGWFWVIWALVGVALESLAVANGWHNGDTLTENILGFIPGWLIYAFLGWLLWHFRRAR